jgi:hypothetical protein
MTGTTGAPVFAGSEPSKMVVTNDHKTLYVYLAGAFGIRSFDLDTQTSGATFSIGQHSFLGSYTANDFEVAPDDPTVIAVARYYLGTSPPQGGAAIFQNGIQRPATGPDHSDGCHYLVFANSGSTMYCSNDYGIKTMTVNSNGIAVTNGVISAGAYSRLKIDNGIIYTSGGQMIAPSAGTLLGTFPNAASQAFVSDAAIGRAFYLVGGGAPNTWDLKAFDLNTFTEVGSLAVSGVLGAPTSLVRWGTNGLAFRTSQNQVFLIQTSLIPTNNPLPEPPPVPSPSPTPTPAPVLTFVRKISTPANDFVYNEPTGSMLLAVPGAGGPGLGNTITHVDPSSGQIQSSVFIGSEPNRLAQSSDGQVLYATLEGANSIRRYDIPNRTAGSQFTTTSAFFRPHDMEVQPGSPGVLVLAGGTNGVAVYDNGVQRSNTTKGGAYAIDSIEFSDDSNILYGYDYQSSGFELSKFVVDAGGVSGSLVGNNLLSGYSTNILFSGGLIYSTTGRVIEPVTKHTLGTYEGGGDVVAVDPISKRVFFIDDNVISVFDRDTFRKIGTAVVPGFSGISLKLARWGENGLAFLGAATQFDPARSVYLLQSTLVSPSASVPSGVQMSTPIYNVSEGTQTVGIAVIRTGDISAPSSISYATASGTATSGYDFVQRSGTLSFAAGEMTKYVAVPIINDGIFESNETFNVVLSNPGGNAQLVEPTTSTVYINDDDSRPYISASDLNVDEPAQAITSEVNVPIQLSNPSAQAISVNYATVSGSATSGNDFVPVSGTINFAPMETLKYVTVQIKGDAIFEGDETFNVNLSGATNAYIYINQAKVTIRNFRSRQPADFDGDGRTDVSFYRPSDGSWNLNRSSAGASVANWGNSTDIQTPGDFDGDGKTDTAVYRPSTGDWYILNSSDSSYTVTNWGNSTDKPVAADYDGDEKADIAVYRPSEGTWYIVRSSNGVGYSVNWGIDTDLPVPADYDGDGKADTAVFRPSDGTWYVIRSLGGGYGSQWGALGDKPVQADYDGDGKVDLAVFRPSDGNWYVYRSGDQQYDVVNWGAATDIPVPGDYDGDGRDDIAQYRESTGDWFVLQSTSGFLVTNWGTTGDKPIPAAYIP